MQPAVVGIVHYFGDGPLDHKALLWVLPHLQGGSANLTECRDSWMGGMHPQGGHLKILLKLSLVMRQQVLHSLAAGGIAQGGG